MRLNHRKKPTGFTLIEMVGVLAVIAILAAILVPKIFATINESRISSGVTACSTAKTAAISYFGKYGRFGKADGSALLPADWATTTATAWGSTVLYKLGYTEKAFSSRVGSSTEVILAQALAADADPTAANAAYELDGDDATVNDAATGIAVVAVQFTEVDADDAKEMDYRIDSAPPAGDGDPWMTKGRVKYDAANKGLLVYIAHK